LQIPKTANLFFKSYEEMWVLKVFTRDMSDALKWPFHDKLAGCCHLYGQDLGSHKVVDAKTWQRRGAEDWNLLANDDWLE
jgi:uncharacterized protein (DUF952 family)